MPEWTEQISGWVGARSAAKHRVHINKILDLCGGKTKSGFIALTHCLSLTDTLWVKSEAEDVSWAKVNLYENKFDDYLSRRGPVIGSDYVAPAKAIMTPAIRACVEEIRETELVLECDERFSEKRLATMNMIKNVQCDRILGIDAKWKWA